MFISKLITIFFIGFIPTYVYSQEASNYLVDKHHYSIEFYYSTDTTGSFVMKDVLTMCDKNNSIFDSLTKATLLPISHNPSNTFQFIDSIRINLNTSASHFTSLIRRGNNTPLRITSNLSTNKDSSIYDYYLFPISYKDELTGQRIKSFKLCFFYKKNIISLVIKEIPQFTIFYYLSNHNIDSVFSTLNGVKTGVEYKKESKELTVYCGNTSYHALPKDIFYTSKFHKKYCAIHPYYWFVGTLQNFHFISVIKKTSILAEFTSPNNDTNSFPLDLEQELNITDIIIRHNIPQK